MSADFYLIILSSKELNSSVVPKSSVIARMIPYNTVFGRKLLFCELRVIIVAFGYSRTAYKELSLCPVRSVPSVSVYDSFCL